MNWAAFCVAIFTLLSRSSCWAGQASFGPVSPEQAQSLIALYSSPRASSLGMDRGFAAFMLGLRNADLNGEENARLRELLGPLNQARAMVQNEEEILPKARELVFHHAASAAESARKPDATIYELETASRQIQYFRSLMLFYAPAKSKKWEELGAAYKTAQARLSLLRDGNRERVEDSALKTARALGSTALAPSAENAPAPTRLSHADVKRLAAEISASGDIKVKLGNVDILVDAAREDSQGLKRIIVRTLEELIARCPDANFARYLCDSLEEIRQSQSSANKGVPLGPNSS